MTNLKTKGKPVIFATLIEAIKHIFEVRHNEPK